MNKYSRKKIANTKRKKKNFWKKIVFVTLSVLVLIVFAFWGAFKLQDFLMIKNSKTLAGLGETIDFGGGDYDLSEWITYDSIEKEIILLSNILLETHPEFEKPASRNEFEVFFEKTKTEILQKAKEKNGLNRNDYYFSILPITAWLGDAHTRLSYFSGIKNDKKTFRLPLTFKWLSDGLVIETGNEELSKGQKILKIGNYTPEEYLEKTKTILSFENIEWNKFQLSDIFPEEYFLSYFGTVNYESDAKGDKNAFVLISAETQLSTQSTFTEVRVPLETAEKKDFSDNGRKWFGWNIYEKESTGFFWLDACDNTEEYNKAVDDFFAAVKEKNIKKIAIDLRRNTGGDSSVIDEFLCYLPLEKVDDYKAIIRYSGLTLKLRETTAWKRFLASLNAFMTPLQTKNDRLKFDGKKVSQSEIFNGEVFILTSKKTFSSGNYFATVLSDNKAAVIVGEETGNAPTCYGDIMSFVLPESKIGMTISYKKFERPDPSKDPADSLKPDISVALSSKNYYENEDPQLDWVLKKQPAE